MVVKHCAVTNVYEVSFWWTLLNRTPLYMDESSTLGFDRF